MYIKYGRFYISWYNCTTFEFGVDTKDKARQFDTDELKSFVELFGLSNYEVER